MLRQRRCMWSIMLIVICLFGCSNVFALSNFMFGGSLQPNNDWGDLGNWYQDWVTPATNLPTAADDIYMVNLPGAVVTQPGAAGNIYVGAQQSNPAWQLGGSLDVQSAGGLTAANIYMGVQALNQSTMTLNGGTVHTTGGTWVGRNTTAAGAVDNSLTINSGLYTADTWFGVNYDAWGADDGAHVDVLGGELHITGGIIAANGASSAAINVNGGDVRWDYGAGQTAIIGTNAIQISGSGRFLLDGDRTTGTGDGAADYFINTVNWIASGDGGTLQVAYDSGTGYTAITSVPEPATMCLLAMGVLALRRRKK